MSSTPPVHSNRESLSVPAARRPHTSRHHSFASGVSVNSSQSHPRPQHKEYFTSGAGASIFGGEPGPSDDAAIRWLFEGPDQSSDNEAGDDEEDVDRDGEATEAHAHFADEPGDRPSASGQAGGTDHDLEWELAREGSIARRPAWRRPRPVWIYPFIVAATMSMGMASAPRSELFINLACLSHPPRQPSSMDMVSDFAYSDVHLPGGASVPSIGAQRPWIGGEVRPNASIPITPPSPGQTRSPADEWFYKLQKEIYEWELAHNKNAKNHDKTLPEPSATSGSPAHSTVMPSGPLPHPTDTPTDGDGKGKDAPGQGGSDRSPINDHPPFRAIDPSLCKKDPKVQAAAARLTMSMTLVMGILSALTTGYWGQKSDRLGRTKVMCLVTVGLMLNEINFVLVASFPYLAPGGYRALLIGPFIDGLFGGFSTISATVNAYISDTTPDGSRASAFARLTGIMMFGIAAGPALGSAAIRATGNIMVPFYIIACVHAIYIPLYYFLLPESLSTEARIHLRKMAKISREKEKRRDALEREWENEDPEDLQDDSSSTGGRGAWLSNANHSRRRKRFIGRSKRLLRRMFKFARPLQIFAPQERPDGRGKDYNLTLLGLGFFVTTLMMGNMIVKTQYAFYAFGWTSAQVGPYMSLLGLTRGITLLVIVPIIMHYVKPRFRQSPVVEVGAPPDSPDTVRDPSTSTIGSSAPSPVTLAKPQPSLLDLVTVRTCMFIEFCGWLGLATGPKVVGYILCSMVVTLGSATGPALSSLALSMIASQTEAGRLFGAVSVIQAVGATLISPLIFGNLFALTVGWYAPTIFALCAIIMLCAQLCMTMIRLENPDDARAAERGRSRRIKRVNSSGVSRRPDIRRSSKSAASGRSVGSSKGRGRS